MIFERTLICSLYTPDSVYFRTVVVWGYGLKLFRKIASSSLKLAKKALSLQPIVSPLASDSLHRFLLGIFWHRVQVCLKVA